MAKRIISDLAGTASRTFEIGPPGDRRAILDANAVPAIQSFRLPNFFSINAMTLAATNPAHNDLRLTTESGVPVSTSDRSGQGTIYLAGATGAQIALAEAAGTPTLWYLRPGAGVSLSLTGLTSGKNYDVFASWSGSVVTLTRSAAWTNDTTRATALGLKDGVPVMSDQSAFRWVGTIRATGTNTTEDGAAKRFVWNRYNQVPRKLYQTDATSHTYDSNTIREWNAGTGGPHRVEWVSGDAAQVVTCGVGALVNAEVSGRRPRVGLGLDTTSGYTERCQMIGGGGVQQEGSTPHVSFLPGLGYHYLAVNENSIGGTGSVTLSAYAAHGWMPG